MEFSSDGTLLLTAGNDEYNSIAVYDWSLSRLIAVSKVDSAKINAIAWRNTPLNNEFVTTGQSHIKFWTLEGKNLK